jgi:murein tripeptide amidase MpaA
MIRFLFLLTFCICSLIFGQSNSTPYINKSLIKIHSSNQAIVDSLLDLGVVSISCRSSILTSSFIVDSVAISWLHINNIPFSIIQNDIAKMIDLEMKNIKNKKNQRSSNWYSVYRELDEIEEKIDDIIASPLNQDTGYITKTIIGQSYEGRDIWAIKLSSSNSENTFPINPKPAIVINGCQHAREWITPVATTYLIEHLPQLYYSNSNWNLFLDEVDVYIIPVVNPDGYVYTWEKDRWWRKNRQINVGSECVGTDLNRNWDFDWNGEESTSEDPCSYIYVGSGPFSAPETSVVSQYISSIPNLVNHIDVHNYSSLIVGPWSSSDESTEDNDEIFCLGTQMQAAVSNTNNYPYLFGTGTVNELLYLISGGMVDWIYGELSSLSFLYELRPASLYYFDSSWNGLEAFDNEEEDILPTCEEFFQGVKEMIKWAYWENCEVATGCSDPEADNYYCNTELGTMGCLYNVDLFNPPQINGAYNLTEYSLPLGFIDDGSCVYSNSLQSINTSRIIIKTIDILGREDAQNRFRIDLYNNGTAEKIYSY